MVVYFCFLTVVRRRRALIARARVAAIGGVSVGLRRRSAASSVRSTLLGEAGWHRADFAEARTLDDR